MIEENAGIPANPGIVSETVPKPQEKPVEDQIKQAKAQLAPEEIAQLEAYMDNASRVIWMEKTQPAILQELQGKKSPAGNLSSTTNHIHKRLAQSMEKTGEQMTDKTMYLGGNHTFTELVLLSEAAGLFILTNKQKMDAWQLTMLEYFREGIETGKIDPVELQKEIEPLMSPEQRQYGLSALNKLGNRISKTPPPSGQNWVRPMSKNRPPQPQPQPSAEVPAGLVGQGGI